ncbi:hypothetical protein [Acidovorax sp. RAC01]|uniref:hypothetical protein n=1 Tax=Acidovorax sp. RAC01 TaxID=1842533 RepID=UPI0012E9BBAE|nr:hypothetical protein [Acidovorax sp. RAC01]
MAERTIAVNNMHAQQARRHKAGTDFAVSAAGHRRHGACRVFQRQPLFFSLRISPSDA